MSTVEWTDGRGRENVLVLDDRLDFGQPEPLPVHPFEARRYLNRREQIMADTCWCSARAEHLIHATDESG